MYKAKFDTIDDFSQWQKDRVRARLFAYYHAKKRKNYSCNQLALDICEHKSTDLFNQIEERYFESENLNSDLGLPIRGNNLNKWFNGINDTEGKNKRPFRKFHIPDPHVIPAIYKFLNAEGWIDHAQMLQPQKWPKNRHDFNMFDFEVSDVDRREFLPYFCRDFKLQSPVDLQFMTITGQRSDDIFKLRMSGFMDSILMRYKLNLQDKTSYRTWRYFWGWMLPVSKQTAILSFEDVEPEITVQYNLILIGSRKRTKRDKHASTLYFIIPTEEFSNHDILDLVRELERENNQFSDADLPEVSDLAYSVGVGQNLTNLMKQYNISHSEARKPKWMFSGFNEQPKYPDSNTNADYGFLHADELLSQYQDGIRGTMSEQQSIWQKISNNLNLKPNPLSQLNIEECTDAAILGERLRWGIMHSSPKDIPILIRQGVDINYRCDETGGTALHLAAALSAGDHIRELAKHPKLDFLARSKDGRLSSTIALDNPNPYPAIARYLILKEKQQAANTVPPVDYELFLLQSLKHTAEL